MKSHDCWAQVQFVELVVQETVHKAVSHLGIGNRSNTPDYLKGMLGVQA